MKKLSHASVHVFTSRAQGVCELDCDYYTDRGVLCEFHDRFVQYQNQQQHTYNSEAVEDIAELYASFVHAEIQHRCNVGDVAIVVDRNFPGRIEYAVKMVCTRSNASGQPEKYLSGEEGFPPCAYDGIEYTYAILDAIHRVTGVKPEHNVAYGPLVTGWKFRE